MAKTKFYVVWVGRKRGIYRSWAECAAQVDGFPGAKYKSFENEQQAKAAFEAGWQQYIGVKPGTLRMMLHRGTAPPHNRVSARLILWDLDLVDAWLDNRLEYGGRR